MNKYLTRFENWFMRRLLKRMVRQDFDHDLKIRSLYAMIREAAREEFTEDNELTTDDVLREQFEATQHENRYA